ncbi:MAG: hypothetical protein JNL08_12590 [Planctomycetes bacterium]|nr:hypothetical protein [Planctomycetota bacterium]
MRKAWWWSFSLLCLASFAPQQPQRAGAAPIVPAVALSGARSAVTESGYHRLRSAADLARVWLAHRGEPAPQGDYGWFYNRAGVPEVDFAGFEVVAIFGGTTWNSAGFAVEAIDDTPEQRRIRFDHKHYQTAGVDGDGGGKRATPFGFFVLPRTDLPLVLEEDVQGLIGQPPEWQQRARLAVE